MTEQEAEAWVARLTRIWEPTGKRHWSWQEDTLRFFLNFPEGLTISFIDGPVYKQHLRLKSLENGSYIYLIWQSSTGELVMEMSDENGDQWYSECVADLQIPEFRAFADHWLPFFRRGCWLCGCDIEASAHEKAEWMQGFNREEVEAWNLKV